MESIKKYLTSKNLMYGSVVGGVLCVIMWIIYMTFGKEMSTFSQISSVFTSIRTMCILFYVDFVILLVLVGGYAFRIFYLKNYSKQDILMFGGNGIAFLMNVFCLSMVRTIHKLASGDLESVLGTALGGATTNTDMSEVMIVVMLIVQIVVAGVGIYFLFVKKGQVIDSSEAKESETNGVSPLDKFKDYYQTPKGKKNIKIGALGVGALLLVIIGFSVYQGIKKTPINLTESCEVTFTGFSGEGKAKVECNPDYDRTDKDLSTFIHGVNYTVKNDGELKNGDSAVITADYSEATADSCKVKVEGKEKKIKVKGLEVAYKKFAEIPKELSDKFASVTEAKLTSYLTDRTFSFTQETTKIDNLELIGIYYDYDDYHHTGIAHYLYRAKYTKDSEYSTNVNTHYYDAYLQDISSKKEIDPEKDKNMVGINTIDINYRENVTDAQALEWFKKYKEDIEIASETPSKDTYKNVKTEK